MTHAAIADFDLTLKRLIKNAIASGVNRGAILHLLIDHAFESQLDLDTFPKPEQSRTSARAVLDEALRLTAIYDDIGAGN
jgi:hypothetical protein